MALTISIDHFHQGNTPLGDTAMTLPCCYGSRDPCRMEPPTFERHMFDILTGGLIWHANWRETAVDYPVVRYASIPAFEAYLSAAVHYVQADGAAILLMTQPAIYKQAIARNEEARLRFAKDFCRTNKSLLRSEYPTTQSMMRALNEFNLRTKAIARSNQVMLLDADQLIPKNLSNFSDDVHYTAAGAQIVGRIGRTQDH